MNYRVWLYGNSMTASYDGYVDVFADSEEDAEYKAKRKLTAKERICAYFEAALKDEIEAANVVVMM